MAGGDAGAVDGQALLAVGGAGLFEGGGDRGVVGHVHLAEDAADFLGGRYGRALFGVQVEQGDLGAGGGDGAGGAFAQARGAAGDHCGDGAVEFHPVRSYVVCEPEFRLRI
jgi:hypothetical protein